MISASLTWLFMMAFLADVSEPFARLDRLYAEGKTEQEFLALEKELRESKQGGG